MIIKTDRRESFIKAESKLVAQLRKFVKEVDKLFLHREMLLDVNDNESSSFYNQAPETSCIDDVRSFRSWRSRNETFTREALWNADGVFSQRSRKQKFTFRFSQHNFGDAVVIVQMSDFFEVYSVRMSQKRNTRSRRWCWWHCSQNNLVNGSGSDRRYCQNFIFYRNPQLQKF